MPDKQTRLPKEAGKRDAALLEQHERANTFILKAVETKVSGEGFAVRLRLPEDPRWAWGSIPQLRLRVYVATDREEGLDVQGLALTPRR
jgi:hypothetical protein